MSNALMIREDMDLMTLGKVMTESGFFQDSRSAAQAVVKILAGRELGFGPIASMTGVNVIKGRVTLSANLIAAAIKQSGRYNYRVTKLDDAGCAIQFFEDGQQIGASSFGPEDAKRAGLGGDNYRKYPRNMFFARAISNGAKWYCPDVFNGPIYTPDELGAEVDPESGEVLDYEPPQVEQPLQIDPGPESLKPNGNGNGKDKPPVSPQELLELVNGKIKVDEHRYKNVSHLFNAIKGQLEADNWTWPGPNDDEAWRVAYRAAWDHAKAKAQPEAA